MISLFTCDLDKWLRSLEVLAADLGRWTVAASVYSSQRNGFTVRVGVRAGAWLPMGRETIVFDRHSEVTVGSPEAQAVERDLNAAMERIEALAKKKGLRFLPCLLDWMPESAKGGAA